MHYLLEDQEQKELVPGFHGRFIHSDNMTFAWWDIEPGSKLPEHQHVHEQVLNMLEGRFELTLNGDTMILETGSVVVIPGNVPHSGRAITPCRILDVFHPRRDEYR